MQIDRDDYINELRDNINSRDDIKARIILDHLKDMDEDIQTRVLFELSRADDDFAIPLLAKIYSMSDDLELNINTIRETLDSKILEFPFSLLSILQDELIVDKTEFIRMAGVVQCNNSVPVIVNLLSKSTDVEFNKVCIQALGKIGNPKVINDVADYLYSGQRELTIEAIKALTEIATADAVTHLSERMGTDTESDRLILQAFSQIQDNKSLEMLNKKLLSHDAYQRNFAITQLTGIGPKSIPIVVDNLSSKNSDLLIHSLNVLGNIGDVSAAQPIRKLLFEEPKDANVRFAAYEALGKLPLLKGAYVLTAGLSDPEEHVHIAAAKALERNMDSTVVAGIKNLMRSSEDESVSIVTAFINAEADGIFTELIALENFQKHTVTYLNEKAHPDVKLHFINVISKLNMPELISLLGAAVSKPAEAEKPLIYAVDDSRMILKIYKSNLHQLGYPTQLFEFPESAIKQILEEKPALVITDLNMPQMNGVELTTEIRKHFDKKSLPIIMVTTQQDLQDREAAFNAGINGIIYKPFTKEQIQAEIEKNI